jgi:hypothetical protein
MSQDPLEKARAVRQELQDRPETIYECPQGDPEHRITLLIPAQEVWCRHGKMKEVP